MHINGEVIKTSYSLYSELTVYVQNEVAKKTQKIAQVLVGVGPLKCVT